MFSIGLFSLIIARLSSTEEMALLSCEESIPLFFSQPRLLVVRRFGRFVRFRTVSNDRVSSVGLLGSFLLEQPWPSRLKWRVPRALVGFLFFFFLQQQQQPAEELALSMEVGVQTYDDVVFFFFFFLFTRRGFVVEAGYLVNATEVSRVVGAALL